MQEAHSVPAMLRMLRPDEMSHNQLRSRATGEEFSRSAVVSRALGLKDLFVHHDLLQPGRRASSPHRHAASEELVYVLAGSPRAWLGERSERLAPGAFVAFPAGAREDHYVENDTAETVELLVVASRPLRDPAFAPVAPGPNLG